MGIVENEMDIRELRKQIEILEKRISQLEAKIIAVQPDVTKSVCPKCKSDDWNDTTKNNRRCNMCGERWQTVL